MDVLFVHALQGEVLIPPIPNTSIQASHGFEWNGKDIGKGFPNALENNLGLSGYQGHDQERHHKKDKEESFSPRTNYRKEAKPTDHGFFSP